MSASVTENAILRAAHFPKEREGAGGVIFASVKTGRRGG